MLERKFIRNSEFQEKISFEKKETEKKELHNTKFHSGKDFRFSHFFFFFSFWVKKRSFDLFSFFQVRSQKTKHLRMKKIIL